MCVVSCVTSAIDDDDPAVSQPLVERESCVGEDGQAIAAEEVQGRLADGTQQVE